MYQLFLLTVVSDYDLDTLVGMDKEKAQVAVAFYMIIVSVIFLNLYVALLSETFGRVFGNATAMSLLSKAKKMLSIEIASSYLEDMREDHLYKHCNPLVNRLLRISISLHPNVYFNHLVVIRFKTLAFCQD